MVFINTLKALKDFMEKVDHDKYPNVEQEYKFELIEPYSKREKFKGE